MAGSGRSLPIRTTEGIELGHVVHVLGPLLITAMEPALLTNRQARHLASGDPPAAEGIGRVIENLAVQPRLAAMPARIKANRVDVHPAVTRCPQLDPDRQPVGLRHVPEPTQHHQAAAQVPGIDSKVEIPMLTGLPASQRRHAPASSDPVPDPAVLQRTHDLDHIRRPHAAQASLSAPHRVTTGTATTGDGKILGSTVTAGSRRSEIIDGGLS